jgi:hypothetical protein
MDHGASTKTQISACVVAATTLAATALIRCVVLMALVGNVVSKPAKVVTS